MSRIIRRLTIFSDTAVKDNHVDVRGPQLMAPGSSAEPPPLPCSLQDQRTPTRKRRQTAPALSHPASPHVIVVSQHLFHSQQLSPFCFCCCPLSTGMVWCMGPRPSCAWLQPLGGPSPVPPPTPHPLTQPSHTFSGPFCSPLLSPSLSLSLHSSVFTADFALK